MYVFSFLFFFFFFFFVVVVFGGKIRKKHQYISVEEKK